jgi:malonyl-CoA/methylmalonyl-CoA synthetase
VPDPEWGERVAAAVILRDGARLEVLEPWLRERLAAYKVPRLWRAVSDLPRNAMGKVTKKEVLGWF